MKKKLFIIWMSVGLGIASVLGYDQIVGWNQARHSPEMVGKCYISRDPYVFILGGYQVEKVVAVDVKKATVTTVYTFLNEPEFKGHWACLQKVGCDVRNVSYFLREAIPTACPW